MVAFLLAVQMLITMALGIITKKTKLVDAHMTTKFSSLLVNVGIPCLIMNSLNVEFNLEEFKSSLIMLLLALLVLLILFLCGAVYKHFSKDKMLGAIGQFGMMFPNYTYIGIPVMDALFGSSGVFLFTIFATPVRVFFYSMPAFLLDRERTEKRGLKETLKVFISPPLVALYVGLIRYFFQIPLPDVVSTVLKNMTSFTSTGGMLVCGMLMSDVKIKELIHRPSVLILPVLCNLITPLAVLGVMTLLPVASLPLKVAVMYTSLPMAAMLPVWVMKYCNDPKIHETCSLYVMLSTVLSVGTLPLMAMLAEKVLG